MLAGQTVLSGMLFKTVSSRAYRQGGALHYSSRYFELGSFQAISMNTAPNIKAKTVPGIMGKSAVKSDDPLASITLSPAMVSRSQLSCIAP